MDLSLLQVGLKVSDSVVVRITGCPNGCARPYMAELGLVGDGPNSYQVLRMSYINPSFGLQEKGQLYRLQEMAMTSLQSSLQSGVQGNFHNGGL